MVRNSTRLLAPMAIVAVAVGAYLIVHANVATHSSSARHANRVQHHARHHVPAATHHAKPRFYTVRSGDTLTEIASRTGVPLTALETLNPSLNPEVLRTGERLRLRR